MKNNKIFIVCLVLLLILSIGYAYFSQSITVSGTASAKGSFDITLNCSQGYHSELSSYYTSLNEGQVGYSNVSCNVSGNNVTMNTNLAYPGSNRIFTIKMTNNGTIDAILKANSKNQIGTITEKVCLDTNKDNAMSSSECTTYNNELDGEYVDSVITYMKDSNGTIKTAISGGILTTIDGSLAIILKPNQTIYLTYTFEWPEDATNANYITTNLTTNYKFTQPVVK